MLQLFVNIDDFKRTYCAIASNSQKCKLYVGYVLTSQYSKIIVNTIS